MEFSDLALAAVIAAILTYILSRLAVFLKIIKEDDELSIKFNSVNFVSISNVCKEMFPIATMYFNGKVFKRGVKVRITTIQKKVFEGEFIGKNDEDVLCVISSDCMVAHEIKKIEDMINLTEFENETKL